MTRHNYRARGFGASFTTLRVFTAAPVTSFWKGDHCVYALVDPRDDTVRYVGYTLHPKKRLEWHLNKPLKSLELWLFGLKTAKLKPRFVILDRMKKHQWADAEMLWIAHGRAIGKLYNKHPGGLSYTEQRKQKAATETCAVPKTKKRRKKKKRRRPPRTRQLSAVEMEAKALDSEFLAIVV